MAGNSDGARSGWESRWEHAWDMGNLDALGPKGQDYIKDKYGESFYGEEPPEDYYDDYDYDYYDLEIEY